MATVATQGFIPRSGVLPQFTPVDPRLAVADPGALLNGIGSGLAFQRGLQSEINNIRMAPLQQQIALAQAEQQLADLPRQEKLRQFSFDQAERQNTLQKLQPFELMGDKFLDFDPQSGALAEFQEVQTVDPQTGQLVGTTANINKFIKTKQEMEQEQRANEALALSREALAEKNFAAATREPTVKTNTRYFYDYPNNRIIQRTIDSSGQPVGEPTVVTGPDGNPVPPPPQRDGGGGEFDDLINTGLPQTTGVPAPGVAAPVAAPVTGTTVPNVEFIGPEHSFESMDEATMAAQLGFIRPGQTVLIGGRRAVWE